MGDTHSLAAVARVPMEASESLATSLLAVLEAPEVISWAFSVTELTVSLTLWEME